MELDEDLLDQLARVYSRALLDQLRAERRMTMQQSWAGAQTVTTTDPVVVPNGVGSQQVLA